MPTTTTQAPTWAATLTSARESKGLTQQQASYVLHVGRRTLCAWEAGKAVPLTITQEGALARLAAVVAHNVPQAAPSAPVGRDRPKAGALTRSPVRAPSAKAAGAGREERKPLLRPNGKL